MNFATFRRVVSTFVDNPKNISWDRGTLLMQASGNEIMVTYRQQGENLIVSEHGKDSDALTWIARRLARLDVLSEQLIATLPQVTTYIPPSGAFSDHLERATKEGLIPCDDAKSTLSNCLLEKIPGVCEVYYLTSDAGDGKSTLINQMALERAQHYRRAEASSLIVPVPLGGRPFLSFGDIISATLLNQYRFQNLYFDSFMEFVKLGLIIPALDGFEEVFVEGRHDEAISALGQLLSALRDDGESTGQVVIAARQAYFDFKSFSTQAKLWDSLPDSVLTFAQVRLDRWSKMHCIKYFKLSGLLDAENLYNAFAERLGTEQHPLLTRPVLVRQLVMIIMKSDAPFSVVNAIQPGTANYFYKFVNTIVEREAQDKWISKSGPAPNPPLLTVEQHHELLGHVANEMWTSKTTSLPADILDVIAESYSETVGLPVQVSRQIKERLKQHALIVTESGYKKTYRFDHEEFYHFFLGHSLGDVLVKRDQSGVLRIIRLDVLPPVACQITISIALQSCNDVREIADFIRALSDLEGPSSYVKENATLLLLELADGRTDIRPDFSNYFFNAELLRERRLQNCTFVNCIFLELDLESSRLSDCVFRRCVIERLLLSREILNGLVFDVDCVVRAVVCASTSDEPVFAPILIREHVKQAGIDWHGGLTAEINQSNEADPDIGLFTRLLRGFLRTTQMNENVILQRLGVHAPAIIATMIPKLQDAGIVEEVQWQGHGVQHRYRLSASMEDIQSALEECQGSFERFLQISKVKMPRIQ
ncbi:MAG: hypothetical protein HYV27_14140 [Candidatus Hydrogenedentes bacterium]|nr:hypothetical protein [Candidatus Hydrogenedentota bacterium]